MKSDNHVSSKMGKINTWSVST